MPKTDKIQKISVNMQKGLTKELRMKQLADLTKLRDERAEQMARAKMEIGLGREKNVRTYKNLRREYAVIQTLIKEKEMGEKVVQVVQVEKGRK